MATQTDIWIDIPKDKDENYLEAPTDDFGIGIASEKISLATTEPIEANQEINLLAVVTGPPSSSQLWLYNGPTGTNVNIQLSRILNTGGHSHGASTNDPVAVGLLSTSSFILSQPWPQNFRVIHRYSEVCGSIKILNTFSNGTTQSNQADVLIPGFIPIVQSQSLKLKSPRPEHPSPYWGTPVFVQKLTQLANEYFRQRNKPITITDACLQWGGRFDLNLNWIAPHAEHRDGHQADIRSNDMNSADKTIFQSICATLGINVLVEADHWHVRG